MVSPEADAQWFHPQLTGRPSVPLNLCPSPLDFSEPHVASNDSDSELEEASDLQSPAGGAALHRLSFLERQGCEAGTEGSQGSRSGSEEQLGATAGEYGPGAWEKTGREGCEWLSVCRQG